MKHIDSLGVFWLPGTSEDAFLAGRLTFDPEDGGRLQLIGEFALEGVEEDVTFLHGQIDSGPVTINNCHAQGSVRRFRGPSESSFYINSLLLGYHVDPGNVAFETGYLKTSGASDWVGEKVFGERECGTGAEEAERALDWVEYVRPLDRTASFSRGDVTLRYAWETQGSGSVERFEFAHWPVFRLKYPALVPLDLIQKDVGRLSDLLTLCMDEVTTTESLSLARSDARVQMLSGASGPEQQIEFLAPQLSYPEFKKRKTRHAHQMLLTYDELGGIDTVARWLDVCSGFDRALASMMSVKRSSRIFAENRFLNVAFAAEAFHRDIYGGPHMDEAEFKEILRSCLAAVPTGRRDWLKQKLSFANSPTLRRRLTDLVGRTGGALAALLQNDRRWADVVTNVRNHLTHLDSKKVNFAGSDLFYLSESIYAVVRFCMLLEAGVPLEVLAKKAGSQRVAWYGTQLSDSITRVRRQLREAAPASLDRDSSV
jgi:hypothetical protein